MDGLWKQLPSGISAGIGGYLIDKTIRCYIFSLAQFLNLQLFFLLKAYYSTKYRFHKLVVFLDSFNFVQHFNSCKIQSNGPMLDWAHSVKAVYIEKQHN